MRGFKLLRLNQSGQLTLYRWRERLQVETKESLHGCLFQLYDPEGARQQSVGDIPGRHTQRLTLREALLQSRLRQRLVLLIVVLAAGAAMELRLDPPTSFA
jgi:hypothetical protein